MPRLQDDESTLIPGLACRIVPVVVVHLVDGTFELFRYFLSPAAAFDRSAPEALRAVRGVVASVLGMLEGGATHLGVAADHVIESFRNALWPGYKTGEGMDPVLYAQFTPLEDALSELESRMTSDPPQNLEHMIQVAWKFENSTAEYYYRMATEKAGHEVVQLLQILGLGSSDHLKTVSDFAAKRGFVFTLPPGSDTAPGGR